MELCYINNEQSLFRKYAKLVTWFSRTQLGRDYLGLQHKDIGLLLPNGYHRVDGKRAEATFYTRPVYAPKLYPALQRIDAIQHYIVGIDEALKTLTYQLGLTRNYGFAPDVSLATFVPDAHPESTSVDGYVGVGLTDQTWATLYGHAGNSSSDTVTEELACMLASDGASSGNWTYLNRGIFLFDTSSLGTGATILSSTVAFYGSTSNRRNQFSQDVYLVTSNPASNTALANTDFDVNDFGTTQLLDSAFTTGSWDTGGWNTKSLNATGIAAISKTGITKFGMRLKCDVDNSPPAWVDDTTSSGCSTNCKYADNGSLKPTLTVNLLITEQSGHAYFM